MTSTTTTLLVRTGQLRISDVSYAYDINPYKDMYQAKLPDGTYSDYLNLARAKDLLRAIKEKRENAVV